ncbi:MAG: rhomboid family intramembrane serine protease [Planctomycetes bacterium]|nr:rhomboid family intramembrane serine protease [Planctomycetota bacterium]
MIPIRDNIRALRKPLVNYAIIAGCALVFFLQLQETAGPGEGLVELYGMIPRRVTQPGEPLTVPVPQRGPFGRVVIVQQPVAESPVPPWLTLLTCIFLHGGWLHFLGNMWFLFIFGDNVEDRLGHLGYLAFYLIAGVGASLAHLIANAASTVPTIGASGAIAGVMGAYFLLYPRAMVLAVIPIFFIIRLVVLPAPIFLGFWFLLQFLQGAMQTSSQAGGVAWWAHIGGFAFGVAAVFALRTSGIISGREIETHPAAARTLHYRWRPRG